jgi:hypothetical protein
VAATLGHPRKGTVIPILWGRMRLGGQIIWSKGIKEVTTTTSQSAKGGPSVSQTNYTHFCSFAAAFCQGPGTITRIWGDAKLILDKTGTGQLAKNLTVFPTLYTGDENQLADPFISSIEGANVTPAYRGTCYAVWEQLPLANFGNRLPNIRAEVTSNSTSAHPLVRVPWTIDAEQPIYSVTDPQDTTAFLFGASGHVSRVDLASNTEVARGLLDISHLPFYNSGTDTPVSNFTAFAVDNQGYIWSYGTIGGENSFIKFDPWTFEAVASIDITTLVFAYAEPLFINVLVNPDGSSRLVASGFEAGGFSNLMYVVNPGSNTLDGVFTQLFVPALTGDSFSVPIFAQRFPVLDNSGNVYFIGSGYHSSTTPYTAGDWYIWKINLSGGTSHFVSPGPQYIDFNRWGYAGDSSVGAGQAMVYNPSDNTLIVYTGTGAFLRIDASSGAILETVGGASEPQFFIVAAGHWQDNSIGGPNWLSADYGIGGGYDGNSLVALHKGWVQNGVVWAPEVGHVDRAVVYSASDFSQIATYDLTAYPNYPDSGGSPALYNYGNVYDSKANSLIAFNSNLAAATGYPSTFPHVYALHRFYFDRLSTNDYGADQIVKQICEMAGIPDANLDVSQIASLSVEGYPVAQLQNGKDMISTLAQALFFEARETDFKLQFVPRGQSSQVIIDPSRSQATLPGAFCASTLSRCPYLIYVTVRTESIRHC